MATTTVRRYIPLSLLLAISSVSLAFQGFVKTSAFCGTQLSVLSSHEQNDGCGVCRRQATSLLTTTAAATTLGWFGSTANAEMMQIQAESIDLAPGLLASRVIGNVLSPPPYGMEGPDIFYPS